MGNLMNLVMQFRKVCNHPNLFEKNDSLSSFQFNTQIFSFPLKRYILEQFSYISFINRNPIQFIIPKLIFREGIMFNFCFLIRNY